MTEQEEIKKAIKMLKDWNKDLSLMEDEKEGIECHELAIKALEKQIAKKPIDNRMFSECPICENVNIQGCEFCPNCGQKLKWEEK